MKARIKIDPDRQIGPINRNIYGQFMCRRPGCSEGGLYAPESPSADSNGLRQPTEQWIADLKPPLVRWPGGCTGTSYRWLDGVGPVSERPRKIDLHFGWEARYEFGTDEFIQWCRKIGAEPHLNLATGTGTMEEGAAWLEYCNSNFNTYYANLRRKNGHDAPYNVKYWQIGNEDYGDWELGGHQNPVDYAVLAREWAKTLRRVDKNIEIIAVGGNERHNPEWAWEVIPQVAPHVDYIAFHTYWGERGSDDPWHKVLAGPHQAEACMSTISALIKNSRINSRRSRPLSIAVTEWNCAPMGGMMASHPVYNPFKPTFTLRDSLAVASFINIMQRHCREITLATVAQSINVVGLIMVNGEDTWREPVYWPLYMQMRASGPVSLDAWVECGTFDEPLSGGRQGNHESADYRPLEGLSYLDCSVTLDPERRKMFLSLVNRSKTDAIEVETCLSDCQVQAEGTAHVLYHTDPMAMNTPEAPDNVHPVDQKVSGLGSRFTYALPPHSYTILELTLK